MSRIDTAQLIALRTLALAVEQQSLTAAGSRLGLTPSAVSKQLSRLEDALGVRLLERTTRRIRPTAAGLELVERARPLLEALDEAAGAIRDQRTEVAGRVRISATRSFGRICLTPLVARLAAEHPRLELDVVLSAARLDFVDDEIDLAIREGPLDDSSLTARRLRDVHVIACASPAYLARRGTPRSLDDLVRHELLAVPASGPSSDLSRLRGRDGKRLALAPRVRVNDLLSLAALAESDAGIALLPDYVAEDGIVRGALRRILPRTTITRLAVHALYPSRRHLPRRVEVVLDALSHSFSRTA
jgi:DNA-binding transcriptional LysR family regulator